MNLVLKEPSQKILKMLLCVFNGHWVSCLDLIMVISNGFFFHSSLPCASARVHKGKRQRTLSTLSWPLSEVFFRAMNPQRLLNLDNFYGQR